MKCFKCLSIVANVPLLTCGHFCCPECYCDLKTYKINTCLICDKPLKRGNKKYNKIDLEK